MHKPKEKWDEEDLITMAKQKAFELDANAIIQAKLSIKKGYYYYTYLFL